MNNHSGSMNKWGEYNITNEDTFHWEIENGVMEAVRRNNSDINSVAIPSLSVRSRRLDEVGGDCLAGSKYVHHFSFEHHTALYPRSIFLITSNLSFMA
jgi:hypothetical protein